MKQAVHFKRSVDFDEVRFEADCTYTLQLVRRGRTRWLLWQGKKLLTLDYFTNIIIDQRIAQWADDQVAA